jgi:hypothetical protein
MPDYLIIIAVAIVGILAVVAVWMQLKVYKLEKKKKQQQLELETQQKEHQAYLNNSIQVLAQGLIDDQLTLTEGAIRISVLMENCQINEDVRKEFIAFFQLMEATSHIPILDQWKQLPKKQKLKLDLERLTIEQQFKDFVIDAAKRIRGREF